VGIDVVEAFGLVESDMEEDGIAGLSAPFPDDAPIAKPCAVVGLKQAGETGLDAGTFIPGRVHVKGSSAGVSLRLGSSFDFDGVCGLTSDAVRVGEFEAAFIFGAGFQIEDGPREAVGYCVVEILTAPVNVFAANTEKREALTPFSFTGLTVLNGDGGVAVGVALDRPLEAEVQKRWGLNMEAPCAGWVLGKEGRDSKKKA